PAVLTGTLSAVLKTNALMRETGEQAVPSGRDQVGLTAAARHVRRVPGLNERGDDDAIPVDVTEHGAPEGAAGPIAAGQVHVRWKRPALRSGTGQNVVPVGRHARPGDDGAALRERVLHAELVVVAVKIVGVLRDVPALEVLPWAASYPVAGVDGAAWHGSVAAEIGAPGLVARARPLCQRLAMPIGAFQASQVGPLARPDAGDE